MDDFTEDFIECMFFITFSIMIIFLIIRLFSSKIKELPFYTPRLLKINSNNKIKSVDSIIFSNIPAVVYQTYDSSNLSSNIINNFNSNIVNNPEFDFYLYNDYDAREFIVSNFNNELLYIYDSLIKNNQNELWKYCILYKNGGVYMNMNLKTTDSLINIINSLKSDDAIIFTQNDKTISTAVIMVPPNLPIFKELIDSYLNNEIKTLTELIPKYNYNIILYLNDNIIMNTITDNIVFEITN